MPEIKDAAPSRLCRDHLLALSLRFCSCWSRSNSKQEVLHCSGYAVHLGSGMLHLCDLGQETCVTWLGLSFFNCQVQIIKHLPVLFR